ncbi:hypothetical protein [Leadbetterella byssophila]|jgi:hypothetical protein|uniref:hypothetical protein n=1 Tax=Leadbetterella byssophila TaxID=316068 RepID=UPI00399F6B10
MKTISLLVIFLFPVLQSCKQESLKSGSLSKCVLLEQESWTVQSEIQDITGTILKSQFTNDTTQLFIIALDDQYNTEVSPCNLPPTFETLDTKVIVSGKIYTHPTLDYPYPPIELSSINHLNN